MGEYGARSLILDADQRVDRTWEMRSALHGRESHSTNIAARDVVIRESATEPGRALATVGVRQLRYARGELRWPAVFEPFAVSGVDDMRVN